jgi:phospholipid/cholesterol/gamma-HCH transport system permease protein
MSIGETSSPIPAAPADAIGESAAEPSAGSFSIEARDGRLLLSGRLDIHSLPAAETKLKHWRGNKPVAIDLRGLHALDTPGAMLLCALRHADVELTGIRTEHKALLDLVCALDARPLPKKPPVSQWRQSVAQLGRSAYESGRDLIDVVAFLGRAAAAIGHATLHPAEFRLPSISRHVVETGVDALPIVGLLAVMISIVIAYQGVAQLRPYGGEDLTIDLVAVSVLREMGVLITAIMVAGRSGSAFTAEIGVMKAREEIDALKVMGLDPMVLLVVPRLVALVITLPLLTFYADLMGLLGGAVIGDVLLGISPAQFPELARKAIDGSDLFVGLVKAPVFAVVITVVSCMHGLRVTGSAESVGRETTRAVVKAIFLVIVLDALFSILFEKLGL